MQSVLSELHIPATGSSGAQKTTVLQVEDSNRLCDSSTASGSRIKISDALRSEARFQVRPGMVMIVPGVRIALCSMGLVHCAAHVI